MQARVVHLTFHITLAQYISLLSEVCTRYILYTILGTTDLALKLSICEIKSSVASVVRPRVSDGRGGGGRGRVGRARPGAGAGARGLLYAGGVCGGVCGGGGVGSLRRPPPLPHSLLQFVARQIFFRVQPPSGRAPGTRVHLLQLHHRLRQKVLKREATIQRQKTLITQESR